MNEAIDIKYRRIKTRQIKTRQIYIYNF